MASNAVVFKNTGFVWWDVGHAMRHAATRPAGMLNHTHMPIYTAYMGMRPRTHAGGDTRTRGGGGSRAPLRASERAPSARRQQQPVEDVEKELHPTALDECREIES